MMTGCMPQLCWHNRRFNTSRTRLPGAGVTRLLVRGLPRMLRWYAVMQMLFVGFIVTGCGDRDLNNDSGLEEMRPASGGARPIHGQDWTVPGVGMEFIWIEAVNCWVGKYEVTNEEYRHRVPEHDSRSIEGTTLNTKRQPVVHVNFHDATSYAQWLTKRERLAGRLPAGMRYRLPTSSEWPVFARCGRDRKYPWGDQWPPTRGNYLDRQEKEPWKSWLPADVYTDGYDFTCPVEMSGMNEWGLCGVGGNVSECCVNPDRTAEFAGWYGASWLSCDPEGLEIACYGDHNAQKRFIDMGFRLVLAGNVPVPVPPKNSTGKENDGSEAESDIGTPE